MGKHNLYKKMPAFLLAVWMLLSSLSACGEASVQNTAVSAEQSTVQNTLQDTEENPEQNAAQSAKSAKSDAVVVDLQPEYVAAEVTLVDVAELEDEAVALAETPEDMPAAVPAVMTAVASGVLVKENADVVIDYSNTKDGYVMVQYKAESSRRLKAIVKGPSITYTYNLTPQKWAAFPLSDGNGSYQIAVYRNVTGSKYAAVLALSVEVTLTDEFAPFLHSNQYVDFDAGPKTVAKAAELLANVSDPLKKVEVVYDYVVKGMTYDKALAATVKSGYLPVLDQVLEKKSGICFDYAAMMTGMLRSQGVPCKLVVGYAGKAYHAWISVWSEDSGWVDGVVFFNGHAWQRMDPTFASSGKQSQSIMAYIGDGKNYSAKYFY